MKNLVELYYEREIQLFVLVSFALQVFLFFTGSLRRRSTNIFLSVSIWTAYLGADWVAVYALGNLSGVQESIISRRSQLPLSFFWAPFFLIHLGGQDTITAFAMEDNDLWLRHFLNLVVQVVLAVYVFWKSARRQSAELIVSGVFVFIVGVIKYGERTWSLKCGSSKSLESSPGHHYKQRFPELRDSDCDYRNMVSNALCSMFNVLNVFAARNLFGYSFPSVGPDDTQVDAKKMFKLVELELAMMYDDLYTKALVLRTRTGIILRCISHACSFVAFALFLASDKDRYIGVDIAITYSLFIGGFFLDFCAMFIVITSPWTWVWLKAAQKRDWLANLSWFLFSSDIGWPERRPLWSSSIGQYSLLSWDSGSDQPTRSCNQKVMALVRRSARLVGVGKKKLFWMSKLLDTKFLEVDEKTMEFVVEGINRIRDEFSDVASRAWPKLGPFLETIRVHFTADFGAAIVVIHSFTEEYLMNAAAAAEEEEEEAGQGGEANDMMEVCRKLSNYMMYLLVNHPSMLPLNVSSEATLAEAAQLMKVVRGRALEEMVDPCDETLREMVDMWTRLLIYTAGKSRGPMHAAELACGGELITFVWLLMVKAGLGDSEAKRILIANSACADTNTKEAYAFYFAS
ncbi:uncharacterized protein [Oryza sativa Japonica Group]|uniref:Os07g0180100 protein n=3 Tax=Oryza TaxID=4527 RepID=A0A0P0X359_ORYSJ|nr:uncharacterized protein LOC107275522 [Oryza sativa Japonica Group]EAZ38902.1 hypothetical protein OsJ_23321 [Oryza sativa Japonica Group]KAB8104531.1 hypothetical protein EE612_037487 [Oryza sativa]BAC83041.1 hypothetical protein [Oryza sativa Japonica Group]BAT00313.1 Os07g0180100 [Oryza sativa Japonica Group]